MRLLLFTLSLLASYSSFAFQDSVITRGPYLQAGTEQSMVIRWRTSVVSLCTVKYGTSFNQQGSDVIESTATNEHEVTIGGLQSGTKYYYSIYFGTTLIAGGDTSYSFVTNPAVGTDLPVHVWVIGDMGRANQLQKDVRDRYWDNVKGGRHTDVWLWLGDNAYNSGTDQEYQEKLFDIYPEILRNTVSRPCPGNHDYGSVDAFTNNGPYYENFTMTKNGEAGGVPSGEEGYYSYDYGNTHFVSLNSEILLSYITTNSPMCQWLRDDLASTNQLWKVVYWHQPPYSKGSHDSDDAFSNMFFIRTNVLPILEQYGVDVVMSGHSHNYERSYLIAGHYGASSTFAPAMQVDAGSGKLTDGTPYIKYTNGPNANRGTVYVVCGNGGSTTSGKPLNHPAMYFSQQDSSGFMTIDINDSILNAYYYDSHANLWDAFTIQKSTQHPTGNVSSENVVSYLRVFPNPFSNSFKVEFSLQQSEEITIDLLDMSGRVVRKVYENTCEASSSHQIEVSATDLQKGNYLVRLKGNKHGEAVQTVTLTR